MDGVAALSLLLAQYVTTCPKTKIILLGFSQLQLSFLWEIRAPPKVSSSMLEVVLATV
ncbi:hypothetical protein IL306_005090 [Fusarium sp. DS 682]|nr:hypothetical protein IL306_005090 [Fusarium sp. DS 682]